MKFEKTHIDQIRKQFADLECKEDLAVLLSDAKSILYGKECMPIQLKSLTYYANPEVCNRRYKTFSIKKKSGSNRTIHAPVKGLKSILRSLNFVLQCIHEPHEAATGFVQDKSIVNNARKHAGHNYVLNLDLSDFFHSFDRNRVKMGFIYEPFNLGGDKEPLAFLLASLCTHPFEIKGELKTVLPQGSPTSPTLTNILCKKLDHRLNGLANRFGATYTRYADDITFSSPHNIYNDEAFNKELGRIIEEDQGLVINLKKTRLQKSGYRQEVTGLIVNRKVNVRRKYIKQIRMWLYYWEKYGYEKAAQIFKRDYISDKGHIKNTNSQLVNVLNGKLEFLKMVKGSEDSTYKVLNNRFESLLGEISIKQKPSEVAGTETSQTGTLTISLDDKTNTEEEGKVQLIIRSLGFPTESVLAKTKYISAGTKLPYKEQFFNKKAEKSYFPHNPKALTDFLLDFKRDGSGLKELIHVPNEEIDINQLLNNAKAHRVYRRFYGYPDLAGGMETIPKRVYMAGREIIESFEKDGIPYSNANQTHPFGDNGHLEYTELAKRFKSNYRFGPIAEGYTNLLELIRKACRQIVSKQYRIVVLPSEETFELRANFYTWIPSVLAGLNYIISGINEHSNNEIEIQLNFSVNREKGLRVLELCDVGSNSKRPAEAVLNDFRMSEAFGKYFRSVCDWTVDIPIENRDTGYRIRVLKSITDISDDDIIEIHRKPMGFTHKLTFYDAY